MKPEVKDLDAIKRQVQADFRARKKAREPEQTSPEASLPPFWEPPMKPEPPKEPVLNPPPPPVGPPPPPEIPTGVPKSPVAEPVFSAEPSPPTGRETVFPKPPQEPIGEKSARLKGDLEEKRLAYARMDVDMSGKWAKLKKTLGFNIAEAKDAGVQASEEAYYESLWKYIEAERDSLPAGEKEAARALLKSVYLDEATQLKSLKEDEAIKMKKGQGEWSDKCADGYKKATDWWRGLSLKKKLAYSGALFGLGFAGVGVSFTAVGASFFVARMVPRLLGAGAMYAGAKKWQEARYEKKREEEISEEIESFLNDANWENRLKSIGKSRFEKLVKTDKSETEATSLKHKRRAFYLAAALPALGTALDIYRMGFGGAGKGVGAVGEGKGAKISAKAPPGGKSTLGGWAQETPVTGAKVPENIPVSKAVELGSDTIRSGGSLWRSTEHIIRGNPEKFGLDPNSKTFVRDARKLTYKLLDEYAKKNGASYDDLDKLARKRVWAGNVLKIFSDPATGKMEISYSGGEKLFGHGNVSGAGAVAEEMSKESLKHGGGAPASAVHEYGRGGGRVAKVPEWLQAHNDNIAMKKATEAYFSDVQKGTAAGLREIQEIHHENITTEAVLRQGVATRGLLKNIINDAGIGNNNAIWEQPATRWYAEFANSEQLVSQDVSQNDSIGDINKKREILKKIFSQLPKPQPGQTTWQALLEALKRDPSNLEKINRALGRN